MLAGSIALAAGGLGTWSGRRPLVEPIFLNGAGDAARRRPARDPVPAPDVESLEFISMHGGATLVAA